MDELRPSNTEKRLKELMKSRKLRQVDVLELCAPFCQQYNVKLGKSALSQYLSGKYEPDQYKLTILGLALNVSEAWLMGYDVPMQRTPSAPTDSSTKDKFIKWIQTEATMEDLSEIFEVISKRFRGK